MKNFERKIFYDLYKSSGGLFVYTFYSRYKITPEILSKFVGKFLDSNMITFENNRITLTDSGRKFVENRKFTSPYGIDTFANIPQEFKGEKIEIDQPYLPNRSELPKEILNLRREGGKETSI